MKTNTARERLRAGLPAIGTWLTMPCPITAHLLSKIGFHWLTVEMEHIPYNWETAAQCFANIASGGTVPLARVPWNTGENIKRALDGGAMGVVIPMVNAKAEAEAAVEFTRFHPHGQRSVGGYLHSLNHDTDPAEYFARANDEVLLVVMAEHVKGIANIDDILSVPGIDGVFIGPNDLLNSMGRKPSFHSDAAEFTDAVEHVRVTAKKRGVASGIHVINPDVANHRIAEGFQFLAMGSDAGFMLSNATEAAKTLGLGPKAAAKY